MAVAAVRDPAVKMMEHAAWRPLRQRESAFVLTECEQFVKEADVSG
jgi:hypothetical protein